MSQQVMGSKSAFAMQHASTPPPHPCQQHMQKQDQGRGKMNSNAPSLFSRNKTTNNITPTCPSHQTQTHVMRVSYSTPQAMNTGTPHPSLPRLDGPQDHRQRMLPYTQPQSLPTNRAPPINTQQPPPKTAYRDLLPYCTAETPLNEQQAIGLSDIAGNIKEVMLLAMRARTDEDYARELARAVGVDGMRGIVDFFEDEFEI